MRGSFFMEEYRPSGCRGGGWGVVHGGRRWQGTGGYKDGTPVEKLYQMYA